MDGLVGIVLPTRPPKTKPRGRQPPSMLPSPRRSPAAGAPGARPASGKRTVPHGRSTCSAGPPLRSGLRCCRNRPCGFALRASRKADLSLDTNKLWRSAVAANRNRAGAVGVWRSRGLASSDNCPLRSARSRPPGRSPSRSRPDSFRSGSRPHLGFLRDVVHEQKLVSIPTTTRTTITQPGL